MGCIVRWGNEFMNNLLQDSYSRLTTALKGAGVDSSLNDFNIADFVGDATLAFIILGAFFFVLGILGCVGACCQVKCMLAIVSPALLRFTQIKLRCRALKWLFSILRWNQGFWNVPLSFYVLLTVYYGNLFPFLKNIKITQFQILCDNIASLLCLQYVIFLVVLLLVEVTFIILIFAVRSEVSAKHHN